MTDGGKFTLSSEEDALIRDGDEVSATNLDFFGLGEDDNDEEDENTRLEKDELNGGRG